MAKAGSSFSSQFAASMPAGRVGIRCGLLPLVLVLFLCGFGRGAEAQPTDAGIELFEKKVRPVLAEHCFKCHGPVKQFAELRLDSRKAMLEGGDTAPAVVPGDLKKSLIIDAIRYGDVQMPPDGPLKDHEIAAIEEWVRIGAPWPESSPVQDSAEVARNHWAFQPVRPVTPPTVKSSEWIRTPVDRFILARLEAESLPPSPAAGRRELIRRVSYDLTGLPPSAEEVAAFEQDTDPNAYSRLVERLLASPQYGEHWGRRWLDVARYSDTKGYVYAREEKVFVQAPAYRDWGVSAFNNDLPYDRFIQMQLAADTLAPDDPSQLAAMGFLTLGRRFLGVTPDIVDDRIDVVTRGILGLTVACARCHDHKYDPIPTADYYSLYGVFQNCTERLVQIGSSDNADPAFVAELERRLQAQRDAFAIARIELSDRVRSRITDYLVAQTELHKYHAENFDIVIEKSDLIPLVVRRWEAYLAQPARRDDPLFSAWTRFAELPAEEFASRAGDVVSWIQGPEGEKIPAILRKQFREPPASMREVAERYGALFADFDREWTALPRKGWRAVTRAVASLESDPHLAAMVRVLYEEGSPCVLPAEHISSIERMMDNGTCDLLWKLQGNVDRWIISSSTAPAFAVAVVDKATLTEQRIFRRGNPSLLGDAVPRRSLQVLSGSEREPFAHGSGRSDLARVLTDPSNPLTARVWVNRVWAHHFGAGLVRTTSDFGLRAEPPSHPELLDWLADRFVRGGWSTKDLHRLIVLSNAYQQQSTLPAGPAAEIALKKDPQNRLLWRKSPRRLTFEELRDTWLAASGELDLRMGGRSTDLFATGAPHRRRTLYGYIDRQFVPDVLRMFDVANPDLHSPQRSETTVPQQALFALNHPVIADRARGLSAILPEDPKAMIPAAFRRIYQRDPTPEQVDQCLAYLSSSEADPEPQPPPGAEDWQYGYGEVKDEKVAAFQKLPHFTGSAWQGGSAWPDSKLGWVQLTAEGGHAGNDLKHAAIRRWTAPAAMKVSIQSEARHEVKAGDGIKCWILSSRQGVLKSQVVHNTAVAFNVDPIDVQPGETLDFVVDFNANLHSDQYLWAPVLQEASVAGKPRVWDAQVQFGSRPAARLTPREQLVQVLLLSNEVMFVD